MTRLLFAALVAILGLAVSPPAQARDHLSVGIGLGGCCGYAPYYSPYYYGAYPYYYAPPPVVYTQPPTVIYQQAPVYEQAPAPVYQQAPAPTYQQPPAAPAAAPMAPVTSAAPAPVAASQASEEYTDDKGRTCRSFLSSINGAAVNGTACLQPDGSWRTVGE